MKGLYLSCFPPTSPAFWQTHVKRVGVLSKECFREICATLGYNQNVERGGQSKHDDYERSLSPMWSELVQEKRPHPYRQTKSPLQSVRPGLCPQPRKSPYHRGAAH